MIEIAFILLIGLLVAAIRIGPCKHNWIRQSNNKDIDGNISYWEWKCRSCGKTKRVNRYQ